MRSKVKEAARELGLQVELRTLDESTRTVPEAAAAVGCEVGQIAKTIVFVMDGERGGVVASGGPPSPPDMVAAALPGGETRRAPADEVRPAPAFPAGAAPPIGHGL